MVLRTLYISSSAVSSDLGARWQLVCNFKYYSPEHRGVEVLNVNNVHMALREVGSQIYVRL